jgi:hypothetical protein
MPFKGDENMLVDTKNRAALDAEEGDDQLLLISENKPTSQPTPPQETGMMDLEAILGVGVTNPSPIQNVIPP